MENYGKSWENAAGKSWKIMEKKVWKILGVGPPKIMEVPGSPTHTNFHHFPQKKNVMGYISLVTEESSQCETVYSCKDHQKQVHREFVHVFMLVLW